MVGRPPGTVKRVPLPAHGGLALAYRVLRGAWNRPMSPEVCKVCEELAGRMGTINYEVVCGIGARVPREYRG